jgi:hypothetical protein
MDPLFGSKTDDRAKQYALKIHPDNRAESLTMSVAPSAEGEYLLAHLDHLNDSIDGYQYNVSFYGYYRDSASGRLRRMHVGIYSRRVCGTTSARSGRAVDLLEDLTAYLASLPKWRVSYNPGEIFSQADWELEGDSKDDPKSYEVGRIPVHMNKQVLYSFYASTIHEWIVARAKKGRPVSVPEVLDAVYSIAMTPSPRAWRRVFLAVVDGEGVVVTKKGRRLPHYRHKFPLTALWLKKALWMNNGSVGAGFWRRFQPSLSADFHVELVYSSLRNLQAIVEGLNDVSKAVVASQSHAIVEECSLAYRNAIHAMRKSPSNGGLHNVSDLQGHHMLSVLGYLRIIDDPVHCQTASICSGNSTTKFLRCVYGILTASHRHQLMSFLESSTFGPFGSLNPQFIENLVCEFGRDCGVVTSDSSRSVRQPWCDCLYKGMMFFDVVDGIVVASRQVKNGPISAWVPGKVMTKVVSSCDPASGSIGSNWLQSLSFEDRPTSSYIVDAPVALAGTNLSKSTKSKFKVDTNPWWQDDWVYTDSLHHGDDWIQVKDKALWEKFKSERTKSRGSAKPAPPPLD